MSMRVLLLSDWMSPAGGAETYATTLCDALRVAGDDVRLIACGAGREIRDAPVDVRAYSTERLPARALLQVANPFAAASVRAAVRTFRPDVAIVSQFAYHFSPTIFRALEGIPTIASVMDFKYICPTGTKMLPDGSSCGSRMGTVCWTGGCLGGAHWLRDQVRYAYMGAALARARRVIACSRHVQRALAGHGVEAQHIPLFVPPATPRFERAPASQPLFVYCGRLSVEKGAAMLVRAFGRLVQRVPAARLRLIGQGPERGALADQIAAAGLTASVALTPPLPPRAIEAALADAWAVVAPSIWAEPFGLIALEAIVRGVPVIASTRGGFAETVEDEVTGLLFANGDESALVDRLFRIATRQAFPCHALPDAVVARVADYFSPPRYVADLHRLFETL